MKKIFLIFMIAVFTVSCEKHLSDLNVNTKDPVNIDGENLFVGAEKRLADQIVIPNVNLNNLRLFVQYWQETTYTDESNYDMNTRPIPANHWASMYQDVLANLLDSYNVISETDDEITNSLKPGKLGIIRLLQAYAYANLVETYGNVPFDEALDADNQTPKFGDAQETYMKVLDLLDEGLDYLDGADGSFPADQDNIYGGDVASWVKFGNTLKLRMAMVLSDVDATNAKIIAGEAIDGGVFMTNADDAAYTYQAAAPNNNPLNNELVLSGRDDYVGGKTFITMLNDLDDPRRAAYFDPNINDELGEVSAVSGTTVTLAGSLANPVAAGDLVFVDDGSEAKVFVGVVSSAGSNSVDVENVVNAPSEDDVLVVGKYVGGTIGDKAPYGTHSHANRNMVAADRPGVILSNIESQFLLAEAAQRFGLGDQSAEDYYKAGITASFQYWNAQGVDDYLAKPEVQYDAGNWKKSIGEQAWLALYDKTFAPYILVRRLDYPQLVEPKDPESGFPVRYTYPIEAQSLNETNWKEAADAIGGDKPETRIFWDVNEHNWPGWH